MSGISGICLKRTNQTTSGVKNTRVIRGSADGWDYLGPGTTPAILFK